MQQITRSVSSTVRGMYLSIRFTSLNAYQRNPAAEEAIRRDVSDRLFEEGIAENPALEGGVAWIAAAGAHRGGTNPDEPLHTTVVVKDRWGKSHLVLHVYHNRSLRGLV